MTLIRAMTGSAEHSPCEVAESWRFDSPAASLSQAPRTVMTVSPAALRQRAIELEAGVWPNDTEDRRGAAELLAAFADYDPALLRRALLGDAGSGSAGRDLLADAIECAEEEMGG